MAKRPSSLLERLLILLVMAAVVEFAVLAIRALRAPSRPADVEELSCDLETAWRRLAELQGELSTSRQEREEIERRARALVADRDALLPQLQSLRSDLAAVIVERRETEARVGRTEAERESLRKQSLASAASEAKLREELKEVRGEWSIQLGELRSLRADLESWWDESAKSREAAQEAVRSASEASLVALAEIRSRLEETAAGVKGDASKLDAAVARAESLAAEVGALRKAIDGWEGRLARPVPAADRPSVAGTAPGGGPGADPSGLLPSGFKGLPDDPSPARNEDGGSPGDPSAIEAKVKVVRDGVLVLDRGSRAGVCEGREFEIRRGDRLIARARVERVRVELCGATIVSGNAAEVQAGDLAIFGDR